MVDVWVVVGCLGVVLLWLAGEAAMLRRARRFVPLRIVVMGTRGKSSVTRLIAAGLRAGGRRVVYKTTGSAAMIGGPEGDEQPVLRRSTPTPLEQRGVLRRARKWRSDVLVVEAMSIRAESLFAELRKILVPDIVVITNVRADHVADLEDPAEAFARAVPPAARVFCIDPQDSSLGLALARQRLSAAHVSPLSHEVVQAWPSYLEWADNVALALAVCEEAGVPKAGALQGMRTARPDVGALAAWRLTRGTATWIAVNAFAANDPESTAAVLERSLDLWHAPGQRVVGLLNLRRDRGDRTAQWLSALRDARIPLDRIVLVGDVPLLPARALERAERGRVAVVRSRRPSDVMDALHRLEPHGALLFGFGNIGGLGGDLVQHWRAEGAQA